MNNILPVGILYDASMTPCGVRCIAYDTTNVIETYTFFDMAIDAFMGLVKDQGVQRSLNSDSGMVERLVCVLQDRFRDWNMVPAIPSGSPLVQCIPVILCDALMYPLQAKATEVGDGEIRYWAATQDCNLVLIPRDKLTSDAVIVPTSPESNCGILFSDLFSNIPSRLPMLTASGLKISYGRVAFTVKSLVPAIVLPSGFLEASLTWEDVVTPASCPVVPIIFEGSNTYRVRLYLHTGNCPVRVQLPSNYCSIVAGQFQIRAPWELILPPEMHSCRLTFTDDTAMPNQMLLFRAFNAVVDITKNTTAAAMSIHAARSTFLGSNIRDISVSITSTSKGINVSNQLLRLVDAKRCNYSLIMSEAGLITAALKHIQGCKLSIDALKSRVTLAYAAMTSDSLIAIRASAITCKLEAPMCECVGCELNFHASSVSVTLYGLKEEWTEYNMGRIVADTFSMDIVSTGTIRYMHRLIIPHTRVLQLDVAHLAVFKEIWINDSVEEITLNSANQLRHDGAGGICSDVSALNAIVINGSERVKSLWRAAIQALIL